MLDIRPLRDSDAPAVHRLLGDPQVARWLRPGGMSEPFSLTECEHFVQAQIGHWSAHRFGTSLCWEGGRCVGWSLLQHTIVAGSSEVEIGWTVARPDWGRGLGTRLGRHALDHAGGLSLRSTIAYTRPDNVASRRIMEKLGLSYEREFEHRGLPHVLYRTALSA